MQISIELILSIWAAVLSTILGISKLRQDREEQRIKLFIDCIEDTIDGRECLLVYAANVWKRPVTITEVNIGLGPSFEFQHKLYKDEFNVRQKLAESEPFKILIEKRLVLSNAEKLKTEDLMFSRLWVNLKLSNGREIGKEIHLNPEHYNILTSTRYEQFLLTGEFLNRNLIKEYRETWIRKLKYEKK